MSLNWSIKDVKDAQELIDSKEEAAITEAIVWTTLSVGLQKITEKNAREFFARVRMVERVFGTMLKADGEDFPITPEHIERRIGLTTNVFPDKTQAQFAKSLVEHELTKNREAFDEALAKKEVSV